MTAVATPSVTGATDESRQASAEPAALAKLLLPNVIGFYTHFEATELVGFAEGQASPINLFTLLVAEDRGDEGRQSTAFLNRKPIRLKSLKGWQFGIMRYTRPIADLLPALAELERTGQWRQSGAPLAAGKLTALPPKFVPPDSGTPVPWNHVLKNNFWSGSYVFEWADAAKKLLEPLFDQPARLQDLSVAIQRWVPLGIASLSDRLGNFAVQLPVTVVMSRFALRQNDSEFLLQLAWHPKASFRPLRAMLGLDFDDIISGYMSAPVETSETVLPIGGRSGLHRGLIWDEQNGIVLAATGPSSFITSVALNMGAITPEPRVFRVKQTDGSFQPHRVAIAHLMKNVVGQPQNDDNGSWTRHRMYRDETSRLARQRRFVEYKPSPGQKQGQHEKALQDVRVLINAHGAEGAWLWDPFLSSVDILETLFHCQYAGADLRALSGAQSVTARGGRAHYAERERAVFQEAQSNLLSLRLEYRAKTGAAGWRFHDRFLIFPKTDSGALAWSLGSSVNSLGKQHHILQRVDDGQRIKDSFVELWERLAGPDYLIWKHP